jgi:arylsulfatase A-like enzyme
LIVKPPKSWRVAAGGRVAGLLETRSVAPTLLDAAGLPIPSGVSAPSLLPWILGRPPAPAPAEFVVAESNGLWAVRTNDWKLVLEPRAKKIELFDLVADPGERRDLAASRPEQREAMQALLRRWRAGLKPVTPAAARALDKETEEGLRALGYLR